MSPLYNPFRFDLKQIKPVITASCFTGIPQSCQSSGTGAHSPVKYHGPHEHDDTDQTGQGHRTEEAHYQRERKRLISDFRSIKLSSCLFHVTVQCNRTSYLPATKYRTLQFWQPPCCRLIGGFESHLTGRRCFYQYQLEQYGEGGSPGRLTAKPPKRSNIFSWVTGL